MFCSNCGHPVENTPFCPNCGAKIELPQTPAPVPVQVSDPAPVPDPKPAPAIQVQAPVKKSHKGLFITLGIVGGVILMAVIGVVALFIIGSSSNAGKYELGQDKFDDGNYEDSYKIFKELGDYKDSKYWAEYSKVELDSLDLDALIQKKDFDGVIRILTERKEFFGDESEGREAEKLISEYITVKSAYEDMNNSSYAQALSKFDSLGAIADDYTYDRNYCNAMNEALRAQENNDWGGIIANLYAIQTQDLERSFLEYQKNGDDKIITDAYNGADVDSAEIMRIIKPEGSEQTELLDTAVKGLLYDNAVQAENEENYDEAIAKFEDLGNFLDAPQHLSDCRAAKNKIAEDETTYQQAETYYKNGEYYKAMNAYRQIPGYKDADTKAAKCVKSLPKNGSMKKSNGRGCTIKITAPSGSNVFIKFYDSKNKAVAQVFIRAGKSAKIKLKAKTYTIKVAYGDTWYGKIDLFGDSGNYVQLKNGSSYKFKLARNYTYTLRLMASVAGNVGSYTVPGGASGM